MNLILEALKNDRLYNYRSTTSKIKRHLQECLLPEDQLG